MMSVDLDGLINRIPQEKLNELVNRFTDATTAQEILDFLSSAGIDASDEEARALKETFWTFQGVPDRTVIQRCAQAWTAPPR